MFEDAAIPFPGEPVHLAELVISGTLFESTTYTKRDCLRLVPPATPPGMMAVP